MAARYGANVEAAVQFRLAALWPSKLNRQSSGLLNRGVWVRSPPGALKIRNTKLETIGGFEFRISDLFGISIFVLRISGNDSRVAQPVERTAVNREVVGSIPTSGAEWKGKPIGDGNPLETGRR